VDAARHQQDKPPYESGTERNFASLHFIQRTHAMKHYSEVNNEAEIETLLELLHGFHDAMSKELHVMNRGFVESDGSMYEGQTFDVRLLLQSQWELRAVEFIFVGVTRLNISEAGPYWTGNATIRRDSKTDETEIQFDLDGDLTISAKQAFWRARPDWSGPASRFGTEIPLPDAVTARTVENTWRQCTACSDAFQCPRNIEYMRCPGCGLLTQLEEAG
jgi:hypothetical protein